MPNGIVCVKSVQTTDLVYITVLIGNANQQNGFLDPIASSERYKMGQMGVCRHFGNAIIEEKYGESEVVVSILMFTAQPSSIRLL